MTVRKSLLTSIYLAFLCVVIPVVSAHAATYTQQEQANIELVADFYAALDRGDAAGDLKQKIRGIAERYLRPDYIQHMAAQSPFGSGREGLVRMFEQMPSMAERNGGAPPPQPKVIAVMATGDLVVRISARVLPGAGKEGAAAPMYVFNMFRVQDGKLAEHWEGSSGQMPGPPAMPPGSPPGAAPASR